MRVVISLLAALTLCFRVAGGELEFARDIAPILQRCQECHGAETQESRLRLDSMAGALRGGDSGEPVIVPGKSAESYLIALVTSSNADERMPPDNDALSSAEVAKLRQWIDDEPQWKAAREALALVKPQHWSLQPLERPATPDFEPGGHPVDAFVRDRLRQRGLSPSAAASRRTLIRRLCLVMHGLPPTPQEVAEFLADDRDDAWAQLVERVLSSPRYGQRWAAHWLDLVRFGETHGFETNRERPNAWRYRDWVIDALNQDKPYDQFVREQIAGDALGAPLGTGFLVAGPHDLVQGQDPLYRLVQRQDELADIIGATGATFLGLTVGCARCHNHKFDPIQQSDYYALQAVFAGVQHAERTLPADAEREAELNSLDGRIARLRRELARFLPSADGEPRREAVNPRHNVDRFRPTRVRWVRFTIEATNGAQPCIDELEVFAAGAGAGSPRPPLEDPSAESAAESATESATESDRDPQGDNLALASRGAKAASSGDFVHPLHKLEHINDGQYGNSRSWIASQVAGGWVQIELPEAVRIDRVEWARDRTGKYPDRLATQYRIEGALREGEWRLLRSSADRLPAGASAEPEYDFERLGPAEAEAGRRLLRELTAAVRARAEAAAPPAAYVGRFDAPPPVHRLYRGEPSAPRERVAPGTIAALGRLALNEQSEESERRLRLADWIASPDNPLTARVMANRIWQHHFGVGLVDTPSDFGANGVPPTHPELLDFLAAELRDGGWSLKRLHRVILMSETWRQDSRPRPAELAADAAARLLWRFPPRRLEAEGIRDSILSVSGSLDESAGGPGFSAFEVSLENVRHYFPKKKYGPEDWRRMVYMTKVRQEKDSVFGAFDCPDASQAAPQRSRSTTPLQALSLLNSEFVMQQAERFAARLRREAGDDSAARAALAFQLCFGRPAMPDEAAGAAQFAAEHGWGQLCRALLNCNEFVFIP